MRDYTMPVLDTTPNRRMPRQWRLQVLLEALNRDLIRVLDRLSAMPDQSTPEGDRLFDRMDQLDDRIDAVEEHIIKRRPFNPATRKGC